MTTLVTNIKQLCGVEQAHTNKKYICGQDMAHLPTISNAFLFIDNGSIIDFGAMENCNYLNSLNIIDAKNGMVMPTWCDSHTHIVYAGSRETEFVDKIKGLTYEQIAERGGGILNSANKLKDASFDELLIAATKRINEMCRFGTGAIEIKSGYGLSLNAELKMLRVIKQLKQNSQLTIKSTFLGAHAIPQQYKQHRNQYINLIINEMLPQIAHEGLADYIDVFCDKGFFTVEETDTLLKAGNKYGLIPKIHANELDFSGGVQVGVKNSARSVDHLECLGNEEIECLLNSTTMPTLLPSTAFFLRLNYAPARKMISAGLPIALASDYNPGSSPSGNMPFVIALSCIAMRLTPEEAINAATINGAYAMNLENSLGTIAKNKQANFFITKQIPSIAYMPYSFGSNLIEKVFIKGVEQVFSDI